MRRMIVAPLLFASPLQLSGDPPQVSLVVHGPMGMRIEGSSRALTVAEEKDSVLFTLPLATLQTGIELRDKHMHEALETGAHPLAQLRIQRTALPSLMPCAEVQVDLPAELTLHGQTRTIGEVMAIADNYQIRPDSYHSRPSCLQATHDAEVARPKGRAERVRALGAR
jgi:hypothetical protein